MQFARDKLTASLSRLFDEYEAMVIFLGQMNLDMRRNLLEERAKIPDLTKPQLANAVEQLTSKIGQMRKKFGATRPLGEYAQILQKAPQPEDEAVLMFPAHVGLALFDKYPELSELLRNNKMPWHTRVELDARGQFRRQHHWQFKILEAVLFEDMCFFWNESFNYQRALGDPYERKHSFKKEMALYRAAISSAFYMVEAFCNGIAFEVLIKRRDELSDRELQLVTEWDSTRSRPKHLSIRDKLLQYPRLLLQASAPPLQESNCPDLAFFLSSAKRFRDAIVHASPGTDKDQFAATKWKAFEEIRREDCAKVLDSTISMVDKIATSINRRDSIFWLQRRQEDGSFNESVFD